jgi:hypothetical protein
MELLELVPLIQIGALVPYSVFASRHPCKLPAPGVPLGSELPFRAVLGAVKYKILVFDPKVKMMPIAREGKTRQSAHSGAEGTDHCRAGTSMPARNQPDKSFWREERSGGALPRG